MSVFIELRIACDPERGPRGVVVVQLAPGAPQFVVHFSLTEDGAMRPADVALALEMVAAELRTGRLVQGANPGSLAAIHGVERNVIRPG